MLPSRIKRHCRFQVLVSITYLNVLSISWASNCAANDATNGVDLKNLRTAKPARRLAKGEIVDKSNSSAIDLPPRFQPTLPPVAGSGGVIKSFVLPDKKTGVVSRSPVCPS